MQTDKSGRPRFDLALTMAGAISAGAYTAGVIDFLIQALDAWEAGKKSQDPMAPQHAVSLRAISGASAGAITGAMLGACLKYDFPHRRLGDPGDGSDNPLYDSWVNMIDISHLLQTRDLANDAPPASALDSTRLLEIARKAIDYGEGVNLQPRPYLADPLRFIFTVTNLRGIPFELDLGGSGYRHAMMMHGDTMRFALLGLGETGAPNFRHNEYPLSYPDEAAKWGGLWEKFAMASLASGAFPVGLSPRELVRRTSDYGKMPIVVPGGPGEAARVVEIRPVWSSANPDPGSEYRFVNVDGGTIDNEPLERARIELAGGDPLARNERDGLKADRAIVMVDPFVGPEKAGPSSMAETGLIGSLLATFTALKNQARFRPQDIALAMEDTIYSRYLIAPVRQDKANSDSGSSIACGSLGGFGGFMHSQYRQHDFYLGRRNCQRFLSQYLSLPVDNPLFAKWTAEQKQQYGVSVKRPDGSTVTELPIIPLMPALNPKFQPAAEEKEPAWPKGVFDPASLEKPIKKRLDGLFDAMAHETKWDQKLLGLPFLLGWHIYAKPKIAKTAIEAITKQLEQHGLI
ncbi:MAG: patatin-like phospholipase family protein [Hydrogenophilaceae bacterium]|nr:patatin-like phospholipase family protein [Hydrogenophilaceae bacterium]